METFLNTYIYVMYAVTVITPIPVSATAASCNVMFSIVVYSCYRAFNAVFGRIGRSGSLEVIFQFIQMSPGFIVRH